MANDTDVAALRALLEALNLVHVSCDNVHHAKRDQNHGDECPVVVRVNAARAQLPALLAELEGLRARDAEYCELADLLTEAAKDLESEIDARYGYPDVHPALRNKYNRDSETVARLQKAADRARGEGR